MNTQFCISNLLITAYVGTIFIFGVKYFENYYLQMEEWLNTQTCAVVGYIFILATLLSQMFYILDVLNAYLLLSHPLHAEKHMTMRKLWIYIASVWLIAILISSVPFLLYIRYNKVGLCLPFYAGKYRYDFQFVILYTAFLGICLLASSILMILLLRSVLKSRKDVRCGANDVIDRENQKLSQTIAGMIVWNTVVMIGTQVTLYMSCIGGSIGSIGRIYFTRVVILDAILNPIFAAIRKKNFQQDTKKLLQIIKSKICAENLNLQEKAKPRTSFGKRKKGGINMLRHETLRTETSAQVCEETRSTETQVPESRENLLDNKTNEPDASCCSTETNVTDIFTISRPRNCSAASNDTMIEELSHKPLDKKQDLNDNEQNKIWPQGKK